MNATHVAVILLSLLSCVTASLGVVLALALRENTHAIAAGIGFSTAVMILISLLDLIPEAASMTGIRTTLLATALGAAATWSAHFLVPHLHLTQEVGIGKRAIEPTAYLVALGLILHDVPEGFAMANAYLASPDLGVLVGTGIALHNLPEQFAIAVGFVALHSKRLLFSAALLGAMAEPLGAIVGLTAVGIAPALVGHFLAFAAGAMLFVSFHELIPMARRYRHPVSFLGGALLGTLVYVLLAGLTVGRPLS